MLFDKLFGGWLSSSLNFLSIFEFGFEIEIDCVPPPLRPAAEELLDQASSLADAYKYRESMSKVTVQRPKNWDLEGTYDCTFKFAVYIDEKIITDTLYQVKIPSAEVVEDGGILLVITVQWDVLTKTPQGFNSKSYKSRIDQYHACNKTVFVSKKGQLQSHEQEENTLRGIISRILRSELGIASHESLTRQLVSLAASVYMNNKENEHASIWLPSSKWTPLAVDIVHEITVTEKHTSPEANWKDRSFVYDWDLGELFRLTMEFEKRKICATGENEEEKFCSICLNASSCKDEFFCMPFCPHIYHEYCIMEWLCTKHLNCPLCRKIVCSQDSKWRVGILTGRTRCLK